MRPAKKGKLTAEKRRELMVAAAVAREAILQLHVVRAMRLIEMCGNRVSVMRMISIYTRLHDLNKMDIEALANRACECKDAACAKAVVNDLVKLAEGNKNARGDEEKVAKDAQRLVECVVKAGYDANEFMGAMQKLAAASE